MPPALEIAALSHAYPGVPEPIVALSSVSLEVRIGEFVAIMGSSGSGKSTLLHLIAGLDQPTSGDVRIEGQSLSVMNDRRRTLFRRRRLGVVFQAYNLLPTLTAAENVALPALLEGRSTSEAMQRALELLRRVDVGHRADHRPQALSGGEQQRVAVARALMNRPALLLADEPTGNLDTRHGAEVWKLLSSLVREDRCTVVAVTHEPAGAAFADRVIILKDGRIAGELTGQGEGHAARLATRYAELVG